MVNSKSFVSPDYFITSRLALGQPIEWNAPDSLLPRESQNYYAAQEATPLKDIQG